MSLSKSCSVLGLFVVSVKAHSWLHCSDYEGVITGQDFDEAKCKGYIRGWQSVWGATSFSTDRGVNFQTQGPNWCQSSFDSNIMSLYDDGFPYATWSYGEEITLVWPAKNHANGECFNNIPDSSMKLYYNPTANPETEPSSSSSVTEDWTLLVDWQEGCTPGTDGCGFQNCPKFCENTDDAPCFGKYTVSQEHFPNPGFYTLMWYWIFNPGAPYTTCFEIYIDGETADNNDNNDNNDNGDNNDDNNNDNNNDNDNDNDNNNNNEESDDNDNNSGDDGSNGIFTKEFIIEVPICYSNEMYDQDKLISGANGADYDSDTSVNWRVLQVQIDEENGIEWEATIQTHTNSASDVTTRAYSYVDGSSQLCDSILEAFGNSGDCYICDPGEMKAYMTLLISGGDDGQNNDDNSNASTSNNNNESDDSTGVVVALLLVIIIILLVGAAIVFYKKYWNNTSSAGNGNETIISDINNGQIQPTTQTNIVVAEE